MQPNEDLKLNILTLKMESLKEQLDSQLTELIKQLLLDIRTN